MSRNSLAWTVGVHGLLALAAAPARPAAPATRPSAQPQAIRVLNYTPPDRGFSIGYPAGWHVRPSLKAEANVVVSFLENRKPAAALGAAMISLSPGRLVPQGAGVADLSRSVRDAFQRRMPDGKLLSERDTTLTGKPARETVMEGTLDRQPKARYAQRGVVVGDKFYVLILTAAPEEFDRHKATFDAVSASLQIPAPRDGGARPAAAAAAKSATFESKKHKFALRYPAAWKRGEEAPEPVLLILLPGITEPTEDDRVDNLMVIAMDFGEPGKLNDFAGGIRDSALKSKPGMELAEQFDTTVAGVPARRLTFHGEVNGGMLQMRYLCVVRGTAGIAFQFTADEKDFGPLEPELAAVLDSVQWK